MLCLGGKGPKHAHGHRRSLCSPSFWTSFQVVPRPCRQGSPKRCGVKRHLAASLSGADRDSRVVRGRRRCAHRLAHVPGRGGQLFQRLRRRIHRGHRAGGKASQGSTRSDRPQSDGVMTVSNNLGLARITSKLVRPVADQPCLRSPNACHGCWPGHLPQSSDVLHGGRCRPRNRTVPTPRGVGCVKGARCHVAVAKCGHARCPASRYAGCVVKNLRQHTLHRHLPLPANPRRLTLAGRGGQCLHLPGSLGSASPEVALPS